MILREIDQRLEALIDPETGELLDYDAFLTLQMQREDKLEGVALWYKDLSAQSKAIKDEVDSLNKRRMAVERRANGLLDYLNRALCGERFSTARCQVSFRKSSAVEIKNADALIRWAEESGYDDCIRYKPPEVNKNAVAKLLKAGEAVPHARLVQRLNMEVV